MLRLMQKSVMRFLQEVFYIGLGFWCAGFGIPQGVKAEVPPGTVVAWGKNDYGQTNVPPGLTDVIAVAAGSAHSLALKADGTVVAWGSNAAGQTNMPAGLTNVISIAAGGDHSLALKADGTVVAWGSSGKAATNVPPGLTSIAAIAAGVQYNAALRKDGTVVTWGTRFYLNAFDARDAVSVAACGNYLATVKKDGRIWQYQSSVYSSSSNVIAITGKSGSLLLALTREGTVISPNGYSMLPSLTNVAAVERFSELTVVLKTNGTILCLGSDMFTNTNVPAALKDVVAIAAGTSHALAVIRPGPAFVLQPKDQVATIGGSVVFHTTAVGAGPLRFQWQFNGTNIDAATNASFYLQDLQTSAMGNYQCVLTDASIMATSRVASLVVVPVCAWPERFTPGSLKR